MDCIEIEKLDKEAVTPLYSSSFAAGMDLYSLLDGDIILKPSQRALVQTGIAISIPLGYEGQIRPRSGLALKHGITVLNAPGTIDSDYRGEIKVLLVNLGSSNFVIKSKIRIAQLIISPVYMPKLSVVSSLSKTERGQNGFGSTGTH